MSILRRHWRPAPGDTVLEIGCGNGFGGLLLALEASRVVVTDLARRDTDSHSIGLGIARGLITRVGAGNVDVASCSAYALPFEDASFEAVLSFYVMEHLRDHGIAFREIRRVLRKGGTAVVFVPSWAERIYRVPGFYLYLLRRLIARVRREGTSSDRLALPTPEHLNARTFLQRYPQFPFPPPHGEYTTSWREMLAHRHSKWTAEIRSAGLEPAFRFTTVLLPRSLIETFVESGTLYGTYSQWVEQALGGLPVIRALGETVCFLCRRID